MIVLVALTNGLRVGFVQMAVSTAGY